MSGLRTSSDCTVDCTEVVHLLIGTFANVVSHDGHALEISFLKAVSCPGLGPASWEVTTRILAAPPESSAIQSALSRVAVWYGAATMASTPSTQSTLSREQRGANWAEVSQNMLTTTLMPWSRAAWIWGWSARGSVPPLRMMTSTRLAIAWFMPATH